MAGRAIGTVIGGPYQLLAVDLVQVGGQQEEGEGDPGAHEVAAQQGKRRREGEGGDHGEGCGATAVADGLRSYILATGPRGRVALRLVEHCDGAGRPLGVRLT